MAEGRRGRARLKRFCSGGGRDGRLCGAMSYVPGQPVTAVVVRRGGPGAGRAGGGVRCGWRDRVSPGRRSGRRARSRGRWLRSAGAVGSVELNRIASLPPGVRSEERRELRAASSRTVVLLRKGEFGCRDPVPEEPLL